MERVFGMRWGFLKDIARSKFVLEDISVYSVINFAYARRFLSEMYNYIFIEIAGWFECFFLYH